MVFRGWAQAGMAALQTFFSGAGQTYNVSVFVNEYSAETGWSRSSLGSLYGAATVISGLLMPFIGRAVDSRGQRRVTLVYGLLLGLACLFSATLATSHRFFTFISFFLLRNAGQGAFTLIPPTLVSRWFVAKRSLGMSVMNVGAFASAVVFPPLSTKLLDAVGVQSTWLLIGAAVLFFFLPLYMCVVVNKPEDVGLEPDGDAGDSGEDSDGDGGDGDETAAEAEVSWTLSEAAGTRVFWQLLFCQFERAAVNTALTFSLAPILAHFGLDKMVAASALSVMAAVGFPVTLVMGWVVTWMPLHQVLAVTFTFQVLCILVLLHCETAGLAVLMAVFWGIAAGFERVAFQLVFPNYFGRVHLGSINGLNMLFMVVGSAVGPVVYEEVAGAMGGDYRGALEATIVWPVLCMAVAWTARKPELPAYSRVAVEMELPSLDVDESDAEDFGWGSDLDESGLV